MKKLSGLFLTAAAVLYAGWQMLSPAVLHAGENLPSFPEASHGIVPETAGSAGRTVPEMEELDSSSLAAISSKVKEYLDAIVTGPVSVQEKETDFLITACSDSLVRQAVALEIYKYYTDSKIMGTEAVAVYLCDKWFIPGKIRMRSDTELMGARMFAEFNRSSLIGMQAPELVLKDTLGNSCGLFGAAAGNGTEGQDITDITTGRRYRILYFYSTDCARCRIETILLRNILENDDFPVDFHAVYTGRDKAEWMRYIKLQMNISTSNTRVYHLWDPGMDSDFQIKYGILQTPGLFLISPEGEILGRRLDAVSLEKMLSDALVPVEMEYGSKESSDFYDRVFMPFGDSIRCSDIQAVAEHIGKSSAASGDTLLFKQMTGDLMYYLTNRRGAAYKCALDSLLHRYILGNTAWRTQDDSLKVTSFALVLDDLLSKSPEGSPIPDLKVSATLKECRAKGPVKTKEGKFRLRKAGGKTNYIFFHTEGCPVCKAELEAADSLLSDGRKDIRILLVDMDMLFSSYPDQAEALFEAFDLTAMPFIISTDRKGTVTGRYLSLVK